MSSPQMNPQDFQSMLNWQNPVQAPQSISAYTPVSTSPFMSNNIGTSPAPMMSPNFNAAGFTPVGGQTPGSPGNTSLFGGLLDQASAGNFGSLQGWGSVMGGIGSLVGGFNGLQQMKLAKEQFNFSKSLANRNLANQAAVTNQALRDRRSGRRAVFGGNKGTGAQVSGAPI